MFKEIDRINKRVAYNLSQEEYNLVKQENPRLAAVIWRLPSEEEPSSYRTGYTIDAPEARLLEKIIEEGGFEIIETSHLGGDVGITPRGY